MRTDRRHQEVRAPQRLVTTTRPELEPVLTGTSYGSYAPLHTSFASSVMSEGEALPAAQKSSWSSFLKSIASATGDLSSMTAPPFILSPTSLCEFPSYWGEPTQQFAAIAEAKTPEARHLAVTAWFLSTCPGQFTRREKETGTEKKPLNPFLGGPAISCAGEQFIGQWNGGELKLWAEQVSHHPPVTAYYLENESKGLSFEGNCAQKTSFSGRAISVRQVGHGIVRIKLADGTVEQYLITLPKLKIEGILLGSPYVELCDSSLIQSSTGYQTSLEFRGKGWVSGKAHAFTATVTNAGHTLYVIDGLWTGESHFIKGSKSRIGELFLDTAPDRSPIEVKPISEQSEYESRRAWKEVADGIRKGDFDTASAAKSRIENSERQKRKDEAAAGKPFETRLFDVVEDDPDYHKLVAMTKHEPQHEASYKFKGSDEA
ncbi:BZ3500_MvSof-1268-A1-R1_Chr12-2g03903 [Microbotryum saponariae]|uniref:BZ3500_MvSof-1268-A1-R1_Chr12-2g03903 protein n=1 Tax=Microbotryum saponariae TaxID=289078 RepID=A0A2X0MPU5_9BASI|nr:BZ3500_MvSof-1268-A1-R1_Chr12-2g03903 [Microbotryum saponariae]SCZ99783.1 BZ3501_MvSof-1269-A2-R1_Chr12-2g03485 [Microbotryum saponariae]